MWKGLPLPEGETGDPRWQAVIELVGPVAHARDEDKWLAAYDVLLEHAAELAPFHRELLEIYRANIRRRTQTGSRDNEDMTGRILVGKTDAFLPNWPILVGCLLVVGLVALIALWMTHR